MNLKRTLVFAAAALGAAAAAAAPPPADIQLAFSTQEGLPFDRGDAVEAGEYYALVCAGAACQLQKSQLTREPEGMPPLVDGAATGGYTLHAQTSSALALVRGIPGLKEGAVKTWYANPYFASEAHRYQLHHRNRLYKTVPLDQGELELQGQWLQHVRACAHCVVGDGVAWKVYVGEVERTLTTVQEDVLAGKTQMPGADDFLVWVGDLDGDNQPDLLVRPQARPDYIELALYLSSQLKPGKPWTRAARFYWWDPTNPGC